VGAQIDRALCDNSGVSEQEVVTLLREGAKLLDPELFGPDVQRALGLGDVSSGFGPSNSLLGQLELEARRMRANEDSSIPPSSRFSGELERLSITFLEPEVAALSTRGLRLFAQTVPAEALAAPDWGPGDRVLGVILDERVGRGTAATVWRAKTDDGEDVAVKLFDAVRYQEGLTLSAYRHGVRLMNRLVSEQGEQAPMIRMRAVSLNALGVVSDFAPNGSAVDLPALAWPTDRIVSFFEKLCRAVAAAHDAGVLHRCLKPSNVLLDGALEPILSDFGMVDLPTLAARAPDCGGYAAYAAPEEILGAGTHSPTADVYSLGRILYFLLLGEHPAEPAADIPELAPLRNQPAGLTRIIRKCTTRAPERRYQWVGDLLDDLERFEAYESVGMAGGAQEANFLAHRVSALPAQRWFRDRRRNDAQPTADRGPRARERARGLAWLSRESEVRVAILGGAIAVTAAAGLVFLRVPDSDLLDWLRLAIAFGVALATLALPRFDKFLGRRRLTIATMTAIVAFLINPTSLASYRLTHTLRNGDGASRAAAARELVRHGRRDFVRADLSRGDLKGADLTQARFQGTKLVEADLTGAALTESIFDADSDLTRAVVASADLSSSNAFVARGWSSTRCDELTTMPSGYRCTKGHPAKIDDSKSATPAKKR
jgi:serine/threonine-protein kinase